MTQENGAPAGPVRIELATSELEGGRYRAWADPTRVLTVVAVSTPEDTFAKMVEPRLRELELADDGEADPGGAPPALHGLLGKLREAHARLWRENGSLMREARDVEVSCALAEEDRVYFVKGAPAWVCLLRNGQAHPVGGPPDQGQAAGAALGRSERLGLEVTSLAVRPGDTVVVFACESDLPPDLRAVENLFQRTPDLKRACDGLVNLLGLQAQGACAVALRFVPVTAGLGGARPNPLDDLMDAWNPEMVEGVNVGGGTLSASGGGTSRPARNAGVSTPSTSARPTSESRANVAAPQANVPVPGVNAPPASESGPSVAAPQADAPVPGVNAPSASGSGPNVAGPQASAPVPGAASPPVRAWGEPDDPDFPGLDEMFATLDRHGVDGAGFAEPTNGSEPAEDEPALAAVGLHPGEDDLPRPRLHRTAWIAVLAALVVAMVALVALPRSTGRGGRAADWMEQAWRGGKGIGGMGVLMVAPEPAARAVLVDGRPVAGETPARIDSIPAGRRRVTLDLGPCGTWEDEFTVRAGESLRVAPRLSGSVSVLASDAAAGGRAWIQGREKVPVPAVFDSLPCGWNRIFYEDDRIPMWDRVVLVKPGKATRLMVPNDYRGGQGAVRVEALRLQGREGLVESEGDTVRIDGRVAGATPLDVPLAPGLHSVRVGPVGSGAYAEVFEVKAGGVRSVLARLGEGELPALRHLAPGRVRVRGPILLTVAVSGTAAEWSTPTLHSPDLAPGLREIPMLPVQGGEGVFVGVVNPESVRLGRELRYYFTLSGPGGQTAWSDVFRLYPEAQWAGGAPAAAPDPAGRTEPAVESAPVVTPALMEPEPPTEEIPAP